jgi:glycine/D-amino acid oxidase-like deaminating enzyme
MRAAESHSAGLAADSQRHLRICPKTERMQHWIVIGAGIVGAACAYFLALDGHRVTVIDRSGVARGTTGAGQNNIGVPPGAGAAMGLFKGAADTYSLLRARGFGLGYVRHGHLYVARTAAIAQELVVAADRIRECGVAAEVMSSREARAIEPQLSERIELAVLLPDGAQVSPMQTTFELLSAARGMGAQVVTDATVGAILLDGGRFKGVQTSRGSYWGDGAVLAAGAWSQEVGALAGVTIPVRPRRGHILVTRSAPGWLSHCLIDYGFDAALLAGSTASQPTVTVGTAIQPLPSGNLLIGGSAEDAGFDRTVDRGILARIGGLARELLPEIGKLEIIRTYAGLRPWAPDGNPTIGPCPEVDGILLATGHGSAGINLGPFTGRLIADMVAGRPMLTEMSSFNPARLLGLS